MDCLLIGLSCFMVFVIVTTITITKNMKIKTLLYTLLGLGIALSVIVFVDYKSQTNDFEVWSGKIESVKHKEEYDEWIPPKTETYTTTDSSGKTKTKTRIIPGYWKHHRAKNYISTTDGGDIYVSEAPSGESFTDRFVNNNSELEKFYPIGSPTASKHTYENRLKSSYSLFKSSEIDKKIYKNLPQKPLEQNKELSIDRLVGNFKDKKELSRHLDTINTKLNDTNNKNNKGKIKGYKQVNLMFVNFGSKGEDYGWALQNHWKNGAKNDFTITFGTDSKGNIIWCHTFSWTDVEILKSDVREIMIGKNVRNFKSTMDEVSKRVEDKFDRKQFAEFKYIQVEVATFTKIIMFVVVGLACIVYIKVEE